MGGIVKTQPVLQAAVVAIGVASRAGVVAVDKA